MFQKTMDSKWKDNLSQIQEEGKGAGRNQRLMSLPAGSPVTVNGLPNTFPGRLYEMLEEAKTVGFAHIVSWQPHGEWVEEY